jgi:hypothetical protein
MPSLLSLVSGCALIGLGSYYEGRMRICTVCILYYWLQLQEIWVFDCLHDRQILHPGLIVGGSVVGNILTYAYYTQSVQNIDNTFLILSAEFR